MSDMRTAIVILAATATLAPVSARAQQHDHAVRVRTAVHVDAETQVEQRAAERVRQLARERARAEQNRGQDREEQTERISRTFKATEIDLSNLAGDITITRGGNSIQLEAVKVGRGRTADEAKEMLQFVTIEIAERGARVEVKAVHRGHEERSRQRRNINVSVEYTVTAPEGTKVFAKSLSGNVRVTDIKGEINAVSLSGDISVSNGERVLLAKSTSGDVEIVNVQSQTGLEANSTSGTVRVRNSRAPRMRLGSISGNVVITAVEAPRLEAESISGDIEFNAPLQPNGRYELSSHSGVIRVMPTGNTGFEIDATSFSGNIRSEITLKDQSQGVADTDRRGRGGRTRSLRGVYGDGSATIDATTFSGTVIIGKK